MKQGSKDVRLFIKCPNDRKEVIGLLRLFRDIPPAKKKSEFIVDFLEVALSTEAIRNFLYKNIGEWSNLEDVLIASREPIKEKQASPPVDEDEGTDNVSIDHSTLINNHSSEEKVVNPFNAVWDEHKDTSDDASDDDEQTDENDDKSATSSAIPAFGDFSFTG